MGKISPGKFQLRLFGRDRHKFFCKGIHLFIPCQTMHKPSFTQLTNSSAPGMKHTSFLCFRHTLLPADPLQFVACQRTRLKGRQDQRREFLLAGRYQRPIGTLIPKTGDAPIVRPIGITANKQRKIFLRKQMHCASNGPVFDKPLVQRPLIVIATSNFQPMPGIAEELRLHAAQIPNHCLHFRWMNQMLSHHLPKLDFFCCHFYHPLVYIYIYSITITH